MFNDLNQKDQATSQTPVDDIFAETDKSAEAKKFSGYYSNPATPGTQNNPSEIETQKAGLSASDDLPSSIKGKILKIGLVILLVILLLGLGYLVYNKFLTGKNSSQSPVVQTVPVTTDNATVNNTDNATSTFGEDLNTDLQGTTTTPVSEENVVTTTTPLATTTTPPVTNLLDTDADGLTDVEENVLGTDINLKDTDGDSLSDYDEVKVYNTDAKKVDSDADELSDYEEVKIYNTDPLKADTDGDTYTDGAEVKSGYNPLGEGKMADVQKK